MIWAMLVSFFFCSYVECSRIAPAFYGLERPALEYELPPLLYAFDELEPYLDEGVAKIHYYEYHQTYIQEVNSILKRWRRSTIKGKHASRMSMVDILRNVSHIPQAYRRNFQHFASGFVNHNLYWSTLSPNPRGEQRMPGGNLVHKIEAKFGSFSEFKVAFTNVAANHFGSGFVWLCKNYSGSEKQEELVILATENEDSPISRGLLPILGVDLWEHAYNLKLPSRRGKYVDNWWHLVDWVRVSDLSQWWRHLDLHDEL